MRRSLNEKRRSCVSQTLSKEGSDEVLGFVSARNIEHHQLQVALKRWTFRSCSSSWEEEVKRLATVLGSFTIRTRLTVLLSDLNLGTFELQLIHTLTSRLFVWICLIGLSNVIRYSLDLNLQSLFLLFLAYDTSSAIEVEEHNIKGYLG